MAKYHLNPETGNPGICKATKRCRFEGLTDHYGSKEEAQAAYEAENAAFAAKVPTTTAMLEPFSKSIERALPKLDSVRHNDGSIGGSSVQSRMKAHWDKARYLAQQYVDKRPTWEDRRGFYSQVRDQVMRMRDELGERSWDSVAPEHRLLNARLSALQDNLSDLSGPNGARRERELGLFPAAPAPAKPEPHRHVWTTVGGRYNYEDLECACGATRRVYDE